MWVVGVNDEYNNTVHGQIANHITSVYYESARTASVSVVRLRGTQTNAEAPMTLG